MANTKITAANIDSTSTGITFADLTVGTSTGAVINLTDTGSHNWQLTTDDQDNFFKVKDGTSTTYLKVGTADSEFATNLNLTSGHSFKINGTTRINNVGDIIGTSYYVGGSNIIDTSRNLTNIGTISSGDITSSGFLRVYDGGSQAFGFFKEKTITGTGTSNDLCLFAESITGGGEIHFMTGGSGTKRVTVDSSGNVGIGTSSTTNDAKLIVVGSDGKHPTIKTNDGGANGFTMLADNYTATESQVNFGVGYSSSDLVLSRCVKPSDATEKVYLSSQAQAACKPSAFVMDGDGGFRFLNTDTSATTAVDTAVSLSERMRIDASGNLFLNTTSAMDACFVQFTDHSNGEAFLGLSSKDDNNVGIRFGVGTTRKWVNYRDTSNNLIWYDNAAPAERMRIDSGGHLILGSNISTTEAGKLTVYTDATNDSAIYGYRSTSYFKIVPFLSNGANSSLANVNDSGLFFSDNFVIAKHATGYYGAVFHGNGSIFIGTESEATGSTGGATFSADSNNRRNLICATTSTSNLELIEFRNPNGTVGTIKSNGTSTSYNTSSDYRLKENVTYEFNALDRVAQLKPARFNFITDADTVLDGFLAHEVSSIVPEAVSGEKDETKEKEVEVTPAQYEDDGETLISEAVMETRTVPVYQGIDQSKLVPLLTKAIQEQQIIIDDLKSRIEALEG